MLTQSLNKKVACTPFPSNDIKIEVKGGLPLIRQKNELSQLTVVLDSDCGLTAGEEVWVRGDACKHQYAKEVYEIDGKTFILIPVEMILIKKSA